MGLRGPKMGVVHVPIHMNLQVTASGLIDTNSSRAALCSFEALVIWEPLPICGVSRVPLGM